METTIQKSIAERARLEEQIHRLESMLENVGREKQQLGECAVASETRAGEHETVIQKLTGELELAKDSIAQLNKKCEQKDCTVPYSRRSCSLVQFLLEPAVHLRYIVYEYNIYSVGI